MFTGIIEEIGTVSSVSSDKITIKCSKILSDSKLGDSISVNGVCLTATDIGDNYFSANISPETMRVTALSELKNGYKVNLERALQLSSRLGGHIVSGHIDTVGKISKISKLSDYYEITVSFDKKYNNYVVKKGSISINGISLTIAECGNGFITTAIIPHTYDSTVLNTLKTDSNVNIEFDILAKYIEKKLSSSDNSNITVDFLAENGFC
ncbi:MAG: riboflavin synthase [Cyanobacteria bacterium RUI128]|nr:riboflavin synthase [Cyanobacteria bacterium RUI128]